MRVREPDVQHIFQPLEIAVLAVDCGSASISASACSGGDPLLRIGLRFLAHEFRVAPPHLKDEFANLIALGFWCRIRWQRSNALPPNAGSLRLMLKAPTENGRIAWSGARRRFEASSLPSLWSLDSEGFGWGILKATVMNTEG